MSTRVPSNALAALLVIASASAMPSVAMADDAAPDTALDALRARFRAGLEKYEAGAYADAILVWDAIYRELGPEKGYRLAFNLARAYDAYGDSSRAAENYETYVREVDAKVARSEPLEELVRTQSEDARARLEQLARTKGRIRVVAGARPTAARVDGAEPRLAGFVAYVAAGRHTVSFGTGADATRRDVEVGLGELVVVAPPDTAPETPTIERPTTFETRTAHPFSPVVLGVAGGVVLLGAAVTAATYGSALSTKSDFEDTTRSLADREASATDYASAKNRAYVLLGATAGAAAITGGLLGWYFLGTEQRRIPIQPTASVGPEGAALGVRGRF